MTANAPTLLFIHGFANTTSQWDTVIGHLPVKFRRRSHCFALPGHVGGPVVAADWQGNVNAMLAPLSTFNVRLSDVIVVGYSLGARITLGLLAAGAIERCILIGVHPGLATDAERLQRRAADQQWADILAGDSLSAFLDAWSRQPVFASQRTVAPAILAQRHWSRTQHDPTALAQAMTSMSLAAMPSYAELLINAHYCHRIHCITGTLDTKFSAIAAELHRQQPMLNVHQVAASGHDPTLEQPELLAAILEQVCR